jgi:signal transduction histidine kinase
MTNYKIDTSKTSGFLIALISFVIFVLAYVKMNEDLYHLQKRNDEIVFINETLNNAERVAGFGSWKLNTAENKFILSDNFYRLLDEKPQAFPPSLDKLIEYIHPEDKEIVLKTHQESLKSLSDATIMYRNILKDGTIKHMMSVSKFLNNSKGELVKIGVNQDITALIKNSKALEEKNERLISINSELESFNNIVGHDLQEPLRKIQMFISRIEGSEFKHTAPETTLQYFDKIKSSAQRMQNLMKDLVDYTRTIKGERIFEYVDLNEIMTETLDELSFVIEEKNAQVTVSHLPNVLGIKFQLQQLFINLISNSLKYSKPNTIPIIQVQHENFVEDFVNEKLISANDFFKITFIDNGIGFEQQYADKIFMLFKRLQTDLSYSGTGLGLAICKKVVSSNNGFISAAGIPNVGAVFSVYLPKKNSQSNL